MTIPARRAPRLALAALALAIGALAVLGGLTLEEADVRGSRYQPQLTAILAGPTCLVLAVGLTVSARRLTWFARVTPAGIALLGRDEVAWDDIDWFDLSGKRLVLRRKPHGATQRGFEGAPLGLCAWSTEQLRETFRSHGVRELEHPIRSR